MKFHRRSAPETQADGHRGACPSFARFLHHFTESAVLGGSDALSTPSSDGGGGGGVRMYARWHVDDKFRRGRGPLH